jgi:hypothetical protein
MASASVTSATARGNVVFPRAGMSRSFRAQPGRPPVAALATGSRRNQLRAQLRARSAGPNRFARGGVMPVEAKHSAIPEAQVRRRSRITISFLTTIPPGFPTTRAARSALARAINAPFPPSASPPDLTLPQKPSLHPRRVCLTPRTTATRAASASSASSTKPPRARTWSKRSRCSCA